MCLCATFSSVSRGMLEENRGNVSPGPPLERGGGVCLCATFSSASKGTLKKTGETSAPIPLPTSPLKAEEPLIGQGVSQVPSLRSLFSFSASLR